MSLRIKETWKPVPMYEALYEVSNMGNIRRRDYYMVKQSIEGEIIDKKLKRGEHVSTHISVTTGYVQVSLHKGINKGGTTLVVHRLVAEAFLGKNPLRRQVDHINGIRTDNRVSNLRWANCSMQQNNAKRLGTKPVGEKHYMAVIPDSDIEAIKKRYIPRHPEHGAAAIAREYKLCRSTIAKIISGVNRKVS